MSELCLTLGMFEQKTFTVGIRLWENFMSQYGYAMLSVLRQGISPS